MIFFIKTQVAPTVGNKIYDGAAGSAGFLCEAFEYLKTSKNLTTKDANILQKKTFYGKEKKSLAYIIGAMNMILHGIEAPNLDRNLGKTNPLNENDLAEFVKFQKAKADSKNSWTVNVANVDEETFYLSVKNPHKKDEIVLRDPQDILDEMKALDEENNAIIKKIRETI